MQRGAASDEADLGELVAQEEAPQAATEHVGEEAPRSFEARALEVEAPSAGAPGAIEAKVVEASAADPVTQDTEMEAAKALVPSQESAR